MERYLNRSGDTGVSAYEIGVDSIRVQFNDGWTYLYDNRSAGAANIETMKRLAVDGQGLSTFISRHVKKAYAEKSR